MHKHTAIVWKETHIHTHTHKPNTGRHSKLHTKCLQSGRRRFKMADSWSCVCVCVWEQSGVFCVDWEVGSVPVTDPYRRQIKTALFSWGERQIEGTEALRLHHNSPVPPSWRSRIQTGLMLRSRYAGRMEEREILTYSDMKIFHGAIKSCYFAFTTECQSMSSQFKSILFIWGGCESRTVRFRKLQKKSLHPQLG